MDITLVKSLYRETEKHMDKEVKINGWVRTVRDSKNFAFVEVNDGSFFKKCSSNT
ncbi:asparaginyl-tRNA ligase [Clostridium botulinum CFSAN002367]|nr:asparaginyl-tRNA ligase [Clostridium botulinum CFSAN002367]